MRTRILWLSIGVVAGMGLAVFGAAWSLSGQALFPPWYVAPDPAAGLRDLSDDAFAKRMWMGALGDPGSDFGFPYEDVEFAAEDGSTLRGWFVAGLPGARSGVVTVHGGGADRRDLLRHLPLLHDLGYPVLLFDCREHGASDTRGRGISLGVREHRDVSTAVAWVKRERRLERVAVVGISQGAASVILAAGADDGIDAVIAESPFTAAADLIGHVGGQSGGAPGPFVRLIATLVAARTDGLFTPDPIEAVAAIAPRPLLLIHGTGDTAVPVEHSRRLFARAGEPKTLWIPEGAEHGMALNHDAEGYGTRVAAFLREGIGEPAPPR